jgi:hypothetical protein
MGAISPLKDTVSSFHRPRPQIDGGGNGGDNGNMDQRLRQIERSVGVIEAKLPELATNDAVEARLYRSETKIILWLGGLVVATGIAGKLIGSSAPAPTPPTLQPVIIQMPGQSPAAAMAP